MLCIIVDNCQCIQFLSFLITNLCIDTKILITTTLREYTCPLNSWTKRQKSTTFQKFEDTPPKVRGHRDKNSWTDRQKFVDRRFSLRKNGRLRENHLSTNFCRSVHELLSECPRIIHELLSVCPRFSWNFCRRVHELLERCPRYIP